VEWLTPNEIEAGQLLGAAPSLETVLRALNICSNLDHAQWY
jgi:hypothetical protein